MSDQGHDPENNPGRTERHGGPVSPNRLVRLARWTRQLIPSAEIVNALGTLLLVIATAFLVGVGWWGIDATNDALEHSERAWIIPLGMQPVGTIEKEKPIKFILTIANPGKEPATQVTFSFHFYTIDAYDPIVADMNDIVVPSTESCSALAANGTELYGPTSLGIAINKNGNSGRGTPQVIADQKLANKEKFLVVEGCIAYVTFGCLRHSSFCYVFDTKIVATFFPPDRPP